MKLRKFVLSLFALGTIFTSCKSDDDSDTPSVVPDRDRAEVYAEDLEEIESFLATHYYNYDEFDFTNPYSLANDTFEIVFSEIPDGNPNNVVSLMDSPELHYKMVTDPLDETIEYKLYYLQVREGLGETLFPYSEAFLTYEGFIFENHFVFDSAVTPISLNLTQVGSTSGVVTGFREGLIEFKTANSFTENSDGTVNYHNHGIGTIFVPSGIGYFSQPLTTVDAYTPLAFNINLMDEIETDYDLDLIPSSMEDLDSDLDPFTDDTDGDGLPNFIDNDDDGDGILTKDEHDYQTYIINLTNGETEPVLAANQYEISRIIETDEDTMDSILTIETFYIVDTNGDGTPDYLDDSI